MPELPEVETVCHVLRQNILEQRISHAILTPVSSKVMKYGQSITDFQILVSNRTIKDVQRRGKHIIFTLDKNLILSHLGMSGVWILNDNDKPLLKHSHLALVLKNMRLEYNDVRRFGGMCVQPDTKRIDKTLGPEPDSPGFNENFLKKCRDKQRHSYPVKAWLLNQKVFCGVGNYLACEILFRCKMHPVKDVKLLNDKELRELVVHTKQAIQESLSLKGVTKRDFKDPNGNLGNAQTFLRVYDRAGDSCYDCGTKIVRSLVVKRGTFHCPRCQPDETQIQNMPSMQKSLPS
jgi:formamidopyrimidine-DNA glycosylase